jgi:argininosuccinate lyase
MESVEFNYEQMQETAQTGFMNAWAGATYLVKRGVPFRQAHEHIGKAVRLALEKRCELQDLALEELQTLSSAFDQSFYACLPLQSVLAVHDVPGGTAPTRVKHAIADAKKRIEAVREEVHANA